MQTGKIHTRPQMAHIRRITYLLFNLCVTLCYFVVRQIARMAIIALRLTLFGTLAYWHIGILFIMNTKYWEEEIEIASRDKLQELQLERLKKNSSYSRSFSILQKGI